ncbi:hypothetical protein HPB52_010561 [Rhipicephalus sanguineus]|uniref:C2H2-type domain-containing protein n=1 Tax=Rhipicephalus sanguineus TaxID=34632 RepID=A0A9D4QDH0_RHISA|nr:hypothetical protein HPB52_010561 [Rhipicephalus sanguineus]
MPLVITDTLVEEKILVRAKRAPVSRQSQRPESIANNVADVPLRRCPCGQVLNTDDASQFPGWEVRREVSIQCGLQQMPPLPLPLDVVPSATTGDSAEEGTDHGTGNAPNHERLFWCHLCKYSAPSLSKLKSHLLSHSTVKPFKCEVCPAAFKNLASYKAHICKHTGETLYQCDLCPYSTGYKSRARKRQAVSLETKVAIVKDVQKGTKKTAVAAKYGIADTTVSAIWKNRDKRKEPLKVDLRAAIDMVAASWWQVKPSTIKKCFEKAGFISDRCADAPADDGDDQPGVLVGRQVWSDLIKNHVVSESDTFEDFSEDIDADVDVCEKAATDEDIVAAVRGDEDEAALGSVPVEDSDDNPDVSCKEALEYLTKLKGFCAANKLTDEALQRLCAVEDEIIAKAISKQRQSKITAFFRPQGE